MQLNARKYGSICLKDRVNDHNAEILNAFVTLLATQGWEKTNERTFGESAVKTLAERFKDALALTGFDHALVLSECQDMVTYAKQYLNLAT
jgi:hypothetical protein